MARQQLGAATINVADATTKDYVDKRFAPVVPVFIQQTDPALTTSYIWYQVDASNNLVTVWVNAISGSTGASGTDLYLMV